jgi:hypothetical protein
VGYPYYRRRVVRYFDEYRRKHDYARSISRKTLQGLDWSRPSQRVIVLYPVSLYYAVKKMVALNELRAAIYIVKRTGL